MKRDFCTHKRRRRLPPRICILRVAQKRWAAWPICTNRPASCSWASRWRLSCADALSELNIYTRESRIEDNLPVAITFHAIYIKIEGKSGVVTAHSSWNTTLKQQRAVLIREILNEVLYAILSLLIWFNLLELQEKYLFTLLLLE